MTVIVVICWCRKIFRVTTVSAICKPRVIPLRFLYGISRSCDECSDRGISEKYYSLEFSSLTIVVNSEHFITSKHERNSMKKTERYWFLEAGPTLASSPCWTKCYGLQLVHWSQWTKRAIYIYIYIFFFYSKFWFLITLYTFSGSILAVELLFYSIFFLHIRIPLFR